MSYCRWSSENGYCDVYVYEDVSGGWTTHVAGARPPEGAPQSAMDAMLGEIQKGEKDSEKLSAIYKKHDAKRQAWNDLNPNKVIKHELAGKSFNHQSPGECADHLKFLKDAGFVVPNYAIKALQEEQAEFSDA